MGQKIRVGVVSYLNTKPLLYGIRHSPVMEQVELLEAYPSEIANLLAEDRIDLGLLPIVAIPGIKHARIISDYCIGCDGPVASVALFSEVPIQDVREILLDYQSLTSVSLLKILLKRYWKLEPELIPAHGEDYRSRIAGHTAGLVIGDRAFEQRKVSTYIYDLGEAWKAYTGLNFVFAAWVSNKPLDPAFITTFNAANQFGEASIENVIAATPYSLFDLHYYYHHHVSYFMDEKKKAGMEEFLLQLKQLKEE